MDEQIREWENSSTSSMTSITHIPDDKEKNIKLDTVSEEIGVCPLQGTDCVSGRKVDNAAYIPETQIARGEEENQVFRIKKVGNSYVLKHNNLKVKIPQLDGASGVSVDEDIILIDNEPIYDIEINNGKVKISKIGDAECEVNRSDNNSTNNSGNNETGLYVERQQHQNVEEESDLKKVRGTSQDMQNVLYPPQENRPNPLNHQDTVADVKHTGSFDADVLKQGGKTAFDNPGEQQPSFEEDDKPPIPAPRSKNKEPMSPKAQQMYKKVTFKVTYSLTGSTERKETEIEKKMRQLDYMKWKFATIDLKSFCANLQFSSRKQQYLFQVNDGILQVDIGSVSDASQIEKHIDYIVDMVIEYSKNCIVRQVFFDSKIRREDVEIAVQELSVMKEGIYYAEINNEEFHVIIICHQSIADQIVEGIRKKISKLEAGSKRHTARIKKPPVFRKKMEKESFKELWLQRFPSVNIRQKYIETNHELLVTLEGPKPEIEEAVAMIEQEYLCNEVSFTHVKYSSQFSNIVDVLCEFTCSLQIDEDISVDINGEKETIGICSTSSDTNTDEVTNMVKKCIRRKEINKQVNGPDFTSDFVEELKEKLDEKHKPFIHLTFVNEGLIRVYGLIEHMNSCFSNIEKKVHAERKAGSTVHKSSKEQSQPTSSCVKEIIRIENPLVYECICKSEQFRSVAKRGDIQVKQLNSNLNGFEIHVTGLKEAVDSVKYEVKEIEKNIKEYTMDCEVEGNCVPNLIEHIHNLEKSSDMVVKTEKVQIEPISYDSKKIQWIFAQGSTVQIAKSCSLPGKKVLVRFEEESIKTKQGVKMSESDIVVSVPKWVGGSAKEKINLSERFNECLQACLDRSLHHIDVIVGKVSWKMQTFVKQLLVADLLKELLQKRMTPCLSVCFCGSDEKICDDIYTACCGFFKGVFSTMPADERRVTVTVTNGNLADTKADILVNSVDRMGSLDRGAISKSLLRKSGKEGHKLQAEIRKFKCPLDSLKVYKTGAYLQGCKFIFHGLLEYYVVNGTSQKKLKRFVLDCLKEAESCNCSSIAFPALGTGNLNYPLYEVKAAMFDAVEEFNMSCTGGTSLQDVKFVLFEYEAFQDFKAEQNKRDSKQPCAPSCHTYGNITFKAVNGTIRDIKQDCILYLWESTAFYNAKKRPDQHVLLKEIDEYDRRQLFEKVFPQGRFTNTIVHTFECRKLDYKDVIHAPYEENPSGKQKAVANLLKFAITLKKKSVGLYFDDASKTSL
ncbi:uncharacterized protein LOC132721111 isoform X2 [Ruditapes philippinarum]|uniref:uncharacterized protein LOC132721111 isoform X2 n=1 Tax=Ruditapes philippinarum TaxID=129788 RepID=UPI00295B988F|nr:uncharacterized protein LOC132721111 isoform X2 [Ruditapes philippinarum]